MRGKYAAAVGDLVVPNPITGVYLVVDGIAAGQPIPRGTPLLVIDVRPHPKEFDPFQVWLTVVLPDGRVGDVLQDYVVLDRSGGPVK